MYDIKTLPNCTMNEILQAWNDGFEGYFVNLEMDIEAFMKRIVQVGLSFEHSIVAFHNEKPVGIIMNGFRETKHGKIAWNGGTGVAPHYRGKGVAQALMTAAIDMYKQQGADFADLEAINENLPAIKLYERYGYEMIDELLLLNGHITAPTTTYTMRAIAPKHLKYLTFYDELAPWQCQVDYIQNAEAVAFYDGPTVIGYALYTSDYDTQGQLTKITLFQCAITNDDTIGPLLARLVPPEVELATKNLQASLPVSQYLLQQGFTYTIKQVLMRKKCNCKNLNEAVL